MNALALVALLLAAPVSDLEKRALDASASGVSLARSGKFEEALVQFKLAESLIPRRENLCNIALTYGRMKRWAQAALFNEECRVRNIGAEVPAWLDKATATAERQLKTDGFVLITVRVPTGAVNVTFVALSPDEPWKVLGERRVWLSPGTQTLRFERDDAKWAQDIDAAEGLVVVAAPPPPPEQVVSAPVREVPKEVEVPKKQDVTTMRVVEPPPPPKPPSPAVSLVFGGLAVGAAAFGTVMYFVARGSLAEANGLEAGPAFDTVSERFRVERALTYTSWAVGGALAAASVISAVVLFSKSEVRVAASVGANGAGVVVLGEW